MKKIFSFSLSALVAGGLSLNAQEANTVFSSSLGMDGIPAGYTGKGVTVCVDAPGFDFHHVNFYDPATGKSRIREAVIYRNYTVVDKDEAVYDMEGNLVPAESVREVYTDPALIDTLTTDNRFSSDGTHMAGVAGGSYSGAYLNKAGAVACRNMTGAAPESDLILVGRGTSTPDSIIVDALRYLLRKADQQEQPMVVVTSGENYTSWLDGKDCASSLVSALTDNGNKPGVVVVTSAGTVGEFKNNVHVSLNDDNGHKLRFAIPQFNISGSRIVGTSQTRIFSDDATPFEVSLEFYRDNDDKGFSRVDSVKFTHQQLVEKGVLTASHHPDHDGRYAATFDFDTPILPEIPTDLYPSLLISSTQDCRVRVLGFHTLNGGMLDFPLVSLDKEEEGASPNGNNESSVSSMACTNSVISVGSWYAGGTYTSYDGEALSESGEPGSLSVFSSYCVADDNGVARPDVCAPGQDILSGFNSYDQEAYDSHFVLIGKAANDYREGHQSELGTNSSCHVSAAAAAGVIALWLQADPTLSTNDVREIIRATSVRDQWTAASPAGFGAGKLNAALGLQYILANRPTAIRNLQDGSSAQAAPARKVMRQGRLMVEHGGNTFTTWGVRLQ